MNSTTKVKKMKVKENPVINFTEIEVEDLTGRTLKVDMSKNLGNYLYQTTGDIGVFEFAQKIYKEGKAEITEDIKAELKVMLNNPQCPFIVLVKQKLLEMLN